MLKDVCTFIDGVFADFRTDDYSNNGLQLEAGAECSRVAFAVDACLETIEKAADAGAQLLVVHHGLSWGSGFRRISGLDARRFGLLFKRGLSLYACHLPLDAHPRLGNNAVIAAKLALKPTGSFFQCKGLDAGLVCELPAPIALGEILSRSLGAISTRSTVYDNSRGYAHSIGIVSGGGDSAILDCEHVGVDCLLTGEFSHQHYHEARELGVSVITCGHYDTENTGIKALMDEVASKMGMDCVFIDAPTGL